MPFATAQLHFATFPPTGRATRRPVQTPNPMVYTPRAKKQTMNTSIRFRAMYLVAIASAFVAILCPQNAFSQQQDSQSLFPEMHWRMIGPFRGGRVLPALGIPGNPNAYLGAIAIAASDPQTIYIGTGEADMRSDISFGDGMYKSTDGGANWRNIGLRDSRQIGSILVDPHDANIVLVAALGHAFGPNPERGVYRSTDGGATWTKVLSKDDDTGAIDLCADPANPQIIYASLWQTRRPPWSV